MNTSNIKSYAPKARKDFIAAITKQAEKYGISKKAIAPMEIKGDLAIIDDRPFPATIEKARDALVKKVEQLGFSQTIEQVAYSWFNRLCAIRYMELHDYLGHGRRVLSHPDQPTGYQLLEDCLEVVLPGLNQNYIRELKLDGTKDEELYRELLLAQCHALHQSMPFLFETIDDETELLLPENLTKTDSLIHELITEIPEEDWISVEIIGWLYQFYISEKKDQVIGKVVKPEDIPAATQLFTPNWIVKYMVQNSLGAQWLATYPGSPLKAQMEYYIEPVEQADDVNAQLSTNTPESLNPENLTLIDPACGSGHILVEAYDLFKGIYLERGYRQRDLAKLILEKNLFGLDIDDRAAQLAGFALMMKGRADDHRLFERGVTLNVTALQESGHLDISSLWRALNLTKEWQEGSAQGLFDSVQGDLGAVVADSRYALLRRTIAAFLHAKTLGSLIRLPADDAKSLAALSKELQVIGQDGDIQQKAAVKSLHVLLQQACLLTSRYDAVVANPPYMGSKFYCPKLKKLVDESYLAGKADLYGAFTLRNIELARESGYVGMITIPNWMFITSFEKLRDEIRKNAPISTLMHNGRGVWGSDFGSCAFVLRCSASEKLIGQFLRLFDRQGSVSRNEELELRFHTNKRFYRSNSDFTKIPGEPVVYWANDEIYKAFEYLNGFTPIGNVGTPRKGMATGDNEKFVRFWSEIDFNNAEPSGREEPKWFPYNNGGEYRKWYGNIDRFINWANDGYEIRNFKDENGRLRSRPQGLDQKFRQMISWTSISSTSLGVRLYPEGFISDQNGNFLVADDSSLRFILAFMCSPLAATLVKMLNPTMHILVGNVRDLPLPPSADLDPIVTNNSKRCTAIGKEDWDSFEISWDFQALPILNSPSRLGQTLESSYNAWVHRSYKNVAEMKRLEEENNRLFIDAYGLADELSPDAPIQQITLTVNPTYRYGIKNTEAEREISFREDSMQELVSYAIGCMMGRYSLDTPGLIYANSGNIDFDGSSYTKFPADDDGIVPLTDREWFADDAANRLVEFISVAWDKQNIEENLTFLAANLSPKKGEDSRDTVRRYLCDNFYKDHMKTYKKRPIYWLFSSGKQKAFQCLVYLHRYNEGTLARMRTEYVIPLTAKLSTHVSKLEKDVEASSSTAEIKKLEKEIAHLHKQQTELSAFDEKLRHYADQRISLDLDDGVKVNYGKFGDLLAEVKAIHGKTPEII